jgi:Fe-S cluster assembly protein SufD
MATAIAAAGFSQPAFDAFLAARDEPTWLTEIRRKAWARFQDVPMPSLRDEEWMRTDIRLFKLDRYELPDSVAFEAASQIPLPHALLAAGVDLGGSAVAMNSHVGRRNGRSKACCSAA